MPYTRAATITRHPLPSDPAYWVEMRDHIVYGEVKRATKEAVIIGKNGETSVDNGAMTDYMLLAYISDWNLDDAAGAKLPITAASLELLDVDDVNFLATLMTADRAKKDDERKNSKNS